jgi:hypothetical protein
VTKKFHPKQKLCAIKYSNNHSFLFSASKIRVSQLYTPEVKHMEQIEEVRILRRAPQICHIESVMDFVLMWIVSTYLTLDSIKDCVLHLMLYSKQQKHSWQLRLAARTWQSTHAWQQTTTRSSGAAELWPEQSVNPTGGGGSPRYDSIMNNPQQLGWHQSINRSSPLTRPAIKKLHTYKSVI